MNDRIVIIEIQFNTVKYSDNIYKPSWIDYRMDITMRFTAKSLSGQSRSDFKAFIYYLDETEPLIAASLARHEPLPAHIEFVPFSKRKERMDAAVQGYSKAYVARIDSDNMFKKDYVERLYAHVPKPATQVLISQRGYLYDSNTNRLANVSYASPSFYTFIYDTEKFLSGYRYPLKTHHDAIRYKHELMAGRNFVVVVHQTNVMNKFTVGRKSDLIEAGKVQEILGDFM
ncbi:putative rhamnosyl transferase [Paenibacillus soyae]|uniref:Rhamnosyl transferase n=1 Tax=Paenibacillus soyae TaxID=2969249 RepID=A0A9X2MLV5_9BACL|nr:putative rhamnosyl transferase [Paenibacillus soyae]MCR2804343.1 putative rhamnosyl transferase [Paenibacillus soyae]